MIFLLALAFAGLILYYVNHRLSETQIDKEELEKIKEEAKNFADSNDFRKM